jgi:Rap/ran-GAP
MLKNSLYSREYSNIHFGDTATCLPSLPCTFTQLCDLTINFFSGMTTFLQNVRSNGEEQQWQIKNQSQGDALDRMYELMEDRLSSMFGERLEDLLSLVEEFVEQSSTSKEEPKQFGAWSPRWSSSPSSSTNNNNNNDDAKAQGLFHVLEVSRRQCLDALVRALSTDKQDLQCARTLWQFVLSEQLDAGRSESTADDNDNDAFSSSQLNAKLMKIFTLRMHDLMFAAPKSHVSNDSLPTTTTKDESSFSSSSSSKKTFLGSIDVGGSAASSSISSLTSRGRKLTDWARRTKHVAVNPYRELTRERMIVARFVPATAPRVPHLGWTSVQNDDAELNKSAMVAVKLGYHYELGRSYSRWNRELSTTLDAPPFLMLPEAGVAFYEHHLMHEAHANLKGLNSRVAAAQAATAASSSSPSIDDSADLEFSADGKASTSGAADADELEPVVLSLERGYSGSNSLGSDSSSGSQFAGLNLMPSPSSSSVSADTLPFVRAVVRTPSGEHRVLLPKALRSRDAIKMLQRDWPALIGGVARFSRLGTADAGGTTALHEALANYDRLEQSLHDKYKFGVLYASHGDIVAGENALYSNEKGSEDFYEFLNFLGERVRLLGFGGYRGGLNVSDDSTGKFSLVALLADDHSGIDIMFHVSTLLPFSRINEQQLDRKRHIGNDVVVIVFKDDPEPFDPTIIASQFNYYFVVISKVGEQQPSPSASTSADIDEGTEHASLPVPFYRVAIVAKGDAPPCFPLLPADAVFAGDADFRRWLLVKLVNAERVTISRAAVFAERQRRTRFQLLNQLIHEH